MKRSLNLVVAMAIILGLCLIPLMAMSADKAIEAKITSVTTALDKNGNEYTRLIIEETRKISGVEYTAGVACMAFGDHNVTAKDMKAGDLLKAVVSEREFRGRTSYTIQAFMN